jgi:hypothetical protein
LRDRHHALASERAKVVAVVERLQSRYQHLDRVESQVAQRG